MLIFRISLESRFLDYFHRRERREAYMSEMLHLPVQDTPKRQVSKGKSAVTRALLEAVSEGNKQIARVPFFGSFLIQTTHGLQGYTPH